MIALLHILAIIGKILLALLIFLLVLILLILFFPFTYKADVRKDGEDLEAKGSVSWLFSLVRAGVSVNKSEEGLVHQENLRILGIDLLPILNRIRKGRDDRKRSGEKDRIVRTEAARKPSVAPGERSGSVPEPDRAHNGNSAPIEIEVIRAKRPGPILRLSARFSALRAKVRNACRKLRRILRKTDEWLLYMNTDSFERAVAVLFTEGRAILRSLLPRKIRGKVIFGMDDPAATGMILGCLGVLYPVVPDKLEILPDFLDSRIDADVSLGRGVVLAVPAFHAVRIVLQRDFRRLLRRLMRKEKKNHTIGSK